MNSAIAVYHNDTPYYIPLSTTLGGDSTPSTPATQKQPRNMSLFTRSVSAGGFHVISTIQSNDIPTAAIESLGLNLSFNGDDIPAIVQDIYDDSYAILFIGIFKDTQLNEWIINLCRDTEDSAAGTVTFTLPETSTYQAGTITLTIV